MTRRTLFALGAPAALVTIAACSKSSSGTSNSTTSKSLSTPDRVVSFNWPEITETKLRDDTGYHLHKLVDGAPTVTLYTDYQCPYCAKAEPKFEEAAKKLDGIMNVTVRHMPLNMHANAVPAALAVEAATAQGKHVEMANKLFNTQNDWKNIKERDKLRTLFNDYAKELGLNVEEFDKTLVASDTVKPVQRDYEHAVKIGVKGTPTFAVNDKVVEGLDSSSSVDDLVSTFKREAGVK